MTTSSVIEPTSTSQSLDWDDVIAGNFPNTSHTQRWQQAVMQAAEALSTSNGLMNGAENWDRSRLLIQLIRIAQRTEFTQLPDLVSHLLSST